jgi:hypothetical protein
MMEKPEFYFDILTHIRIPHAQALHSITLALTLTYSRSHHATCTHNIQTYKHIAASTNWFTLIDQ